MLTLFFTFVFIFIRRLKHIKGYTYIQVVDKSSGKYKLLKSFGSYKTTWEEAIFIKKAEKFKRLNEAVVISCYEKGYAKYDYEDYITYKFVIKNKSDKNIRAVKGRITFTNLFDDEISSLNFVYDQLIEAGKEVTWNATTDYNQFKDEDKTLKKQRIKRPKSCLGARKGYFRRWFKFRIKIISYTKTRTAVRVFVFLNSLTAVREIKIIR